MIGRPSLLLASASFLCGAWGASAGCASDHGDLAASEATSTSGAGGASASSTTSTTTSVAATTSVTATTGATTTTSTSTGGGGTGGTPAMGPVKLTIVHGVNDAENIRLCFLDHPGETNGGAMPWPSDAAGLAFARAGVIGADEGVVPADTDVRISMISGDLAAVSGLTCGEILALADPNVIVTAMPVLPKDVFTSAKSLLLVPTGCIGGLAHSDGVQTLVCGSTYTPTSPTVSMQVMGMSQSSDPSAVGLQVVHAAAGMQATDFRVTPGLDAALEVPLAKNMSLGAIAPTPPAFFQSIDLGSIGQVKLSTYFPNDTFATSQTTLATMLATSDGVEVDDGGTFVMVAVGAYPGIAAGAWWHALTYVIVRADP